MTTTVDVGFFDTDKYPDGTPVALVAATNELGSPDKGIPSRPFMRMAMKEKSKEWNDKAEKVFFLAAAGKITWKQAADQIGLVIVGDVKQSITDNEFEPLADSTIAARARRSKSHTDKPLIDTSRMLTSIKHKVDA